MPGEEAALVRAVCEAPDDDVPRLVYADWLEEHGRPERAEFIRLQCGRAGKDGSPRERTHWLRRSIALFRKFGAEWLTRDWPEANPGSVHAYTFDRGFVAALALPRQGLDGAKLRHLTETRSLLALVRKWGLGMNPFGDDGLRAIVACPRLTRLTHLDITGTGFTEAGLELLARSPHLGSLAELVIGPSLVLPPAAPGHRPPAWATTPAAFVEWMTQHQEELQAQLAERQARIDEMLARRQQVEELFRRHGKTVRVY